MDLISIEAFRKRMGRRADKTLEVLGRLDAELKTVFETDIGKEILEYDVKRYEDLLYTSATRQLTVDEQAEFKYIYTRLQFLKEKVNHFLEELAKLGE